MKRERLSILTQHIVPQHGLSRLAGWLSECRWKWFKTWQINYFVNRYQVDVKAALISELSDYPTFNSFFTRLLKPGLRPLPTDPDAIASPADGCISQLGKIENDLIFQAKGFHYTLKSLLGNSETLAEKFQHGQFATIYLSPKDYHRVHMPITGELQETLYVPGKLFSVNQKTTENVPNLFARNERLVCIFKTAIGPMAVIFVGAMLVGSIATIWEDKPTKSKKILHKHYTNTTIERGAELGHFKMGSTVILLFPDNKSNWSNELHANSIVQMGENIGNISLS